MKIISLSHLIVIEQKYDRGSEQNEDIEFTINIKEQFICNPGHNILELFGF